jgi:uncharacterized Zn finger protein
VSAKRGQATTENKSKRIQSSGWADLTWDDLVNWAGDHSVSRGRAYQRQRRVLDLAISEDSRLLAIVTGGERYAVIVWCHSGKREGVALESRCTCPVGSDGCKHAVAVVAEYLELVSRGAEIPGADSNDERWEILLSDDHDETDDHDDLEGDPDEGDDDENRYRLRLPHSARTEKRTRRATDEKIRKHIDAKSREELAALVWSLTERFPELYEEFRDRVALGDGNVDRLVTQARQELKRVASESGWRNNWTGEGHTPDYSRLKHRLERLVELGHADAVVKLGPEIMAVGMEQIDQSNDEGETAAALRECMPVIFRAVSASTLPSARKLLFAIDAYLRDDYGVMDDVEDGLLEMSVEQSVWSEVADTLALRLETPIKEGDDFHRKFQRERMADWLIRALKQADREDEGLAVCKREARLTDSYERMVKLLLETKQYDEAERWSAEGIENTVGKLPGIAASLGRLMGEAAGMRKQWTIVAAQAALEFFERPGPDAFDGLMRAANKAGCQDTVRGCALRFLETGASPFFAVQQRGIQEIEASTDWPYCATVSGSAVSPHGSVASLGPPSLRCADRDGHRGSTPRRRTPLV